ncbi:hypothetical protein QCN27_03810 [Cereibacter sp. SYSU M97828]|nr:hypothetical protein [Cereibacter flavus]
MTRSAFKTQSLVTAPAQPAPRAGQMSHANRVEGRGRSAKARRSVQMLPIITITPQAARVFWSDLMTRRCSSREACAVMFDVTFQTACNWFDGFSTPTGDKVMQAQRWWPEEFEADEAA